MTPTAAPPPPAPSDRGVGIVPPGEARRARITGLDGLRALAVTVVIVFHLSPGGLPGGFLGVDVFFVLSGYLITRLLAEERTATGGIRIAGFWRRRVRRLVPALLLVLIACSTAALFVGGDLLIGLGAQVLGALTFSSNWVYIAAGSSYFDATAPELFRNLWSLAVEEQFYLLWPVFLLVVLLRMTPRTRVMVLLSLAAASAVAMGLLAGLGEATRVYYGTDTHSFGLFLGAALAVATRWWSPRVLEWSHAARRTLGLLGSLSVVGLVVLAVVLRPGDEWVLRGGLALAAVLTGTAILGMLVPGSPLARMLELAPLRWVGERSYGLYLWHWPAFVLVVGALDTWPRTGWGGWVLGGIALVITVAASGFSYRFVEAPIRRDGFRATARTIGRRWRASGLRLAGGLTVIVLVLAGGSATATAIALDPGVSESEAQIEAGIRAIEEGSAAPSTTPSPTPSVPSDPVSAAPAPSEPPDDRRVIQGSQLTAVGDSVMLAAAPALQAAYPGIAIDAAVSRQLSAAPAILQALRDAGTLRRFVVLGLGTNGSISRDTLEQIRSIIGTQRMLIVVTAQAPRGWIPEVNQTLTQFAADYRNVELSDWYGAIQPRLDALNRDQVHFGTTGSAIYVTALQQAVDRLAVLPTRRPPKSAQ